AELKKDEGVKAAMAKLGQKVSALKPSTSSKTGRKSDSVMKDALSVNVPTIPCDTDGYFVPAIVNGKTDAIFNYYPNATGHAARVLIAPRAAMVNGGVQLANELNGVMVNQQWGPRLQAGTIVSLRIGGTEIENVAIYVTPPDHYAQPGTADHVETWHGPRMGPQAPLTRCKFSLVQRGTKKTFRVERSRK
ncbi:MAG: hypothetical protein N2C12_07925, partial [Planctomycetales bacterium]